MKLFSKTRELFIFNGHHFHDNSTYINLHISTDNRLIIRVLRRFKIKVSCEDFTCLIMNFLYILNVCVSCEDSYVDFWNVSYDCLHCCVFVSDLCLGCGRGDDVDF